MRSELLITTNGDNENVLKTVNDVFIEYRDTMDCYVADLRDLDFRSQCLSVFDYVVDNVRYKEDEGLNQWIKTPQCTLREGFADCKSMAILVASCLWCLGVPEIRLRFVSFNSYPSYSHVYVVATKEGESIVIDPVERVGGKPKFDYASSFMKNKDFIYYQ